METDTRRENCQIRIMYGPVPYGPDMRYANLLDRPMPHAPSAFAVIRHTEHSDYSGSTAQRSNYAILSERAMEFGLIRVIGSHGYLALAYEAALGPVPSHGELTDILEGLETYAAINDDAVAELEIEMASEAWIDHGSEDFRRQLIAWFNSADGGHDHDMPLPGDVGPPSSICGAFSHPRHETWESILEPLWCWGCELQSQSMGGGPGFRIEEGGSVHFYIREWFAALEHADLKEVLMSIASIWRIT